MAKHRNPQARLSKPPSPDNDPTPTRDRAVRAVRASLLEHGLDDLRNAVGRTDALADAVFRVYDERRVGGEDDRVEERVSHLIDATTEAATKALEELDQLRADLAGQPSAEDADERS
jgi:hypothetical protein